MAETGVKQLTVDNWDKSDATSELWGTIDAAGVRRLSGSDWAEVFLSVELSSSVPAEIRWMWEVARGVLVYGIYYYPLYTPGDEQLHRVADAATLHCHRRAGGPNEARDRPPTLHKRIGWLLEHGLLSPLDAERWHAIREIRNAGAHPERPRLIMPTDAARTLEILRDAVDSLFSVEAADGKNGS
jgi:hypothetical protein